jgi:hypothetical protein
MTGTTPGENARAVALAATALVATAAPATADWLVLSGAENSPTVAELHVERDRARLVLEVYRDDLGALGALLPESVVAGWIDRPTAVSRPPVVSSFALYADGGLLAGEVRVAEIRDRIDRASPFRNLEPGRIPFSQPPADPAVLYLEIDYALPAEPRRLTLAPPMKANGYAAINVGFIAFHEGVPVIDFRYLSGPETLLLDWRDPWYSRFENPNLSRHHRAPLMSFLYVEPYEVRHEVLVRLRDLGDWMELPEIEGDAIEASDIEALRRRIGEFMLGRNPVTIDGAPARPILDRVDFVTVGLNGVQIIGEPERLDPATAVAGVIIAYLVDRLPREVRVDWDLYTARGDAVPATTIDPAGPFTVEVDPQDSTIVWRNYLRNYEPPTIAPIAAPPPADYRAPLAVLVLGMLGAAAAGWGRRRRVAFSVAAAALLVAVVLVGIARLPGDHARADPGSGAPAVADPARLLDAVLANVYRAFEFRREEDIYDRLAVTVSGDLLARLYLQHRRSMIIEEQGGIEARVKAVAIESAAAVAAPRDGAVAFRCVWTASGRVGHWGHVHQRVNRYEAILTLEVLDGAWKLTRLEFIEERRLSRHAVHPDAGMESA